MKHPDGDICYHDVSFSYEDNEIVLNHIDFTINQENPLHSLDLPVVGKQRSVLCCLDFMILQMV